jgi:hypothetical protein
MIAISLQAQPSRSQLDNLIKQIPRYPISIKGILDFARQHRQPKEVLDFYGGWRDQVFESPDELKDRTEQVEMMRQEEKDMPPEQLVATEEF